MQRIIIDTDTASDDAVAILMALRSSHVQVEAISVVGGNVDFDQQVENALYTVEIAGKSGQVPVFRGVNRPLTRPRHQTVTHVHGRDGMGDAFFPRAKQRPEPEHAVDAVISLLDCHPGEVAIVAIGPFSNIGMLLLKSPEAARKIKSLYFMGGSYLFCGNITPAATYNPWVDPEAARIMLQAGMETTMVGFDATCRYSVFTDQDYEKVASLGTPLADFFVKINATRRAFCKEKQRLAGSNHPDSLTMALLLDPSVATKMEKRFIDVETAGELTRGMLVIDELGVCGREPNVNVCVQADEQKFKAMVFGCL